jgi:hypothetical protein
VRAPAAAPLPLSIGLISLAAQAEALETAFQRKMMSHLRHQILNDFAAQIAWHDVVAIATLCSHSTRASRYFDNVMPREAFYEITPNFVSQSRHRKRFSNRPNAHGDLMGTDDDLRVLSERNFCPKSRMRRVVSGLLAFL